jgi:hypothetical protein
VKSLAAAPTVNILLERRKKCIKEEKYGFESGLQEEKKKRLTKNY